MRNTKILFSAIIISMSALCLTSCTADTSGYKYELISSRWSGEQKGGSEINLYFEGDYAYLNAKSGNDEIEITGRYVADNDSFIIFNTKYPENYKFSYQTNGEKLNLTYLGDTIVLSKEK